MFRKLMASSAIAALMAAGLTVAQAQTEPVEEPAVVEDAASAEVAESTETLTTEQPTLATAFIGQSVYSSEDPESDNIGDVNDLIVSDDGSITHAIVGVGGFLGIGEKDVAVPFDELQVVEQDGEIRLVYASTKEQLEAAEGFDRTAYDPSARFAEEQAVTDATETDPALAPETDTAMTEPAVEEPADTAATEPEPAMEEPADTAATEPATEEPADTATTEPAPAAEEPATTEMAETTEPAANAEQIETAATDTEGFISFNAEQMRASTWMGKEIYGPDDASIGEVADLVLQEDGETRAALIDVGGFLGVGEKRVAIPFENIEVSQPADEGGEPKLTVAMTREELEALPAFEDRTMGAESTATTEPVEAPADGTTVTEAPADADQDLVADGAEPAADAGTYELATQDLTAEELIGSPVYGSDEENLGEVGDVVFADGGEIEAVVIDIGGFLGVGEKPVAVQFDSLNVQKNVNGDVQLMIQATQEQLEAAPTYENETAAVQ
jgi:sporulation protein YlmC with PRC-barrel domain